MLHIIATPLGNPGDLSPRAREALERADVLLAEDTRRTGLLLKRLGVSYTKLVSCYEHNESGRITQVLGWLEQGMELALVSDAGTPLIADPGYKVVRACRDAGFRVSPIPGASAVPTALCASGLPPYPFVFLGFLPRKQGEMRKTLAAYAEIKATLVFFERKDRAKKTLDLAFEELGAREFCLARELTKTHEEFILGRLGDESERDLDALLGELTVIIGPPEAPQQASAERILELIHEERPKGGSPKAVARRVKERVQGWTAKKIYELMQEHKE